MTGLTDTLRRVSAVRQTSADFDVHAALREVLAGAGFAPTDGGGSVTFTGADPVVPSTLRLGTAAGVGLAAKAVALAALWRRRTGQGQDVSMDLRVAPHRLCPFYDRKWELVNGFPQGAPANASQALGFRFYRTADDRWVMPLNPYPKIKIAAQKLLGVPEDTTAVAAAIGRWQGRELEAAGAEAGCVMPLLRSTPELLAEPHYRDVLAAMPLIEITLIVDSEPE
ncbi:MAG: hypothetical protein V7646_7209, partial [Pseudonocardia sp.]